MAVHTDKYRLIVQTVNKLLQFIFPIPIILEPAVFAIRDIALFRSPDTILQKRINIDWVFPCFELCQKY